MSATPTIAARIRARYRVVEAKHPPRVATIFGNPRFWWVTYRGRRGNGSSVKAHAIRSMQSSISYDLRHIRKAAALVRDAGYKLVPPSSP